MVFNVKLSEFANLDLMKAIKYYEGVSQKTVRNFLSEFDSKMIDLQSFPFYQNKHGNYRCLSLRGFPFIIHFLVNEVENIRPLT
jgi:toxin ParE1/3/4